MALGIVVDDAIVISENVYAHRLRGKSGLQAAIDGTTEVAPAVISSVVTTVIAFIPLMFMEGYRGPIFAQIPYTVDGVEWFAISRATIFTFFLPVGLIISIHYTKTNFLSITVCISAPFHSPFGLYFASNFSQRIF